jgi:very-short-patch-repair endonuclease
MSLTSGVVKLQRLSKGKLLQAQELRKAMTPAENMLWEQLRRKNILGVKFRRQQIIEGFIVDFYCESAKLVIEVDGEIHSDPERQVIDVHRRNVFIARGLREIRFANNEILKNIDNVLLEIVQYLKC